jgi:hypothetical protein
MWMWRTFVAKLRNWPTVRFLRRDEEEEEEEEEEGAAETEADLADPADADADADPADADGDEAEEAMEEDRGVLMTGVAALPLLCVPISPIIIIIIIICAEESGGLGFAAGTIMTRPCSDIACFFVLFLPFWLGPLGLQELLAFGLILARMLLS